MKKLISIVIPTLNEEHFLPQLLNNLALQDCTDFEVIIVDAFSEDNTVQKAKQFSEKFPTSVFQVERKNVSFQRNFGAMKAQGKYIMFLDADSQVKSNFMSTIISEIESSKSRVLIPHLASQSSRKAHKIMFSIANFFVTSSHKLGKPLSTGGSFLIEKDLFLSIGGFDQELFVCEDHDLIQKVHKKGSKPRLTKNIKIHVSTRRNEREGELALLYKYLLSTSYILVKGKITHPIYNYEMGGKRYSDVVQSSEHSFGKQNTYIFSRPQFRFVATVVLFVAMLQISAFNSQDTYAKVGNNISSYKTYGKVIVGRVFEPVKAISLKDFKNRNNKKVNQNLTNGFATV